MSELPSGTVTFLFTDLEGSTRLWEEHPEAMQGALARHDEIVNAAIAGHRGHVVKTTGDGFHAAFGTAQDALAATLDARAVLAAEPWPATGPLLVRMGLHTGETQERDGDYYGTAVNRAARVMAVANGGQILCTRATVEVAGDGIPVRSLGEHRLRDLGAPQELFQVGEGVFPPVRSVDAVPTNLPTVRSELIGRGDDLDALGELVRRERLVTLTGVGGVGKTRIALGVAAAVGTEFADGCWFVDLAPVADNDDVVTAVASCLRVPVADLDALAAYLADRRTLVVLDNCEHVLDGAAELVDEVLELAPEVHVLTTSREPLGLEGEHVRRVQSLALPGADASLTDVRGSAAVRLFTERAAAVSADFVVDDANVDAVVEICRHLDGIPLAIELAAARVRAMAPAEIAGRLDERFRLLAGGSRRSQERHRTLQATVAWSHDLLTDEEKVVFRRLSVFPASFDLAAAEAVVDDSDVDVVDRVLRLVDRSLVAYEAEANRYRLLETLRQFGADRLTEAGETEVVRRRHAEWFLALADRVGPGIEDDRFDVARATLTAELDNLRSAADWCIEVGSVAALATMYERVWYFLTQDTPSDGAAWLEHVVDHATELDPQVAVDALGWLAWAQSMNFGDFAAAEVRTRESCAVAQAHSVEESPWAWVSAGQCATFTGRPDDAAVACERALALANTRADTGAKVTALHMLAMSLSTRGLLAEGEPLFDEALRLAELSGNRLLVGAMVSAESARLVWRPEPDFAASLDVFTHHGTESSWGDLSDLWIDTALASTLLGLDAPDAASYAVRGARRADRLNSPHALDLSLHVLAVAAAEAGFRAEAWALKDYSVASDGTFVMMGAAVAWLTDRLERALGDRSGPPPSAPLHRRDLMALVDQLEVLLAVPQRRSP